MKNHFILKNILIFVLILSLSSCIKKDTTINTSENAQQVEPPSSQEKIQVLTTIFPIYDWTRQIVGDNDNIEVSMLLDNGIDFHSFQPSVNDILTISNADVFIYVGGVSDSWVDDVLSQADNKDIKIINLIEVLGNDAKIEELVEGMEADDHNNDTDSHNQDYDEHVWLSLKNAKLFVTEITKVLSELDESNRNIYLKNSEDYISKLNSLDLKYEETIHNSNRDILIFGDRFPFRYLVDDYDLSYYAAFLGCSAETEASFETVVFLSNKLDELNLDYILNLENSASKISQTVIDNTAHKNQKILEMDSLQSTSFEDVKNGATYLSIMEKNLDILKEALK